MNGKKIGLALGSGSARGWAHIGVLRALAEADIRIDYVAGASIGALVGAVYAAGKLDVLEEIALGLDWKRVAYFFSDIVFPKSGLIDGRKVAEFTRSHVEERNIEELPIPFCAVSTDLVTGEEVVLRDGDLIEAIRASISVPGIFTPVQRDETILVDGGLVNPVPVSVARDMGADFIIAVDLNHEVTAMNDTGQNDTSASSDAEIDRPRKMGKIMDALNKRLAGLETPALSWLIQRLNRPPLPNIFEVLGTSINIVEGRIAAAMLKADPPDLLIRPRLGHIQFLEFHKAQSAIAEGYSEAKALIDHINGDLENL